MSRPSRTNYAQKRKLLDFMKNHCELANGRLSCPDGARKKRAQLEELATCLNSVGDGAYKTGDKWYKAWQDWKSDIKAKARKRQAIHGGTGGGPPPPPLNSLEQEVLDFMGPVAVDGLEVLDPLSAQQELAEKDPLTNEQAGPSSNRYFDTEDIEILTEAELSFINTESRDSRPEGDLPTRNSQGSFKRDPMVLALIRQADGIERQAAAQEKQAAAMARQADAIENLAQELSRFTAAMVNVVDTLNSTRYIVTTEEQ